MKLSTLANRVAKVALTALAAGIYLSAGAVTWPSTPLGSTTNATPMTMLVMSKDHKLFYEAYNDASDVDGDGTLDIRFKPSINYYGLFDSGYCYNYSSDRFEPAGTTDDLGRCTGSAQWSGRWLNYMTTSRIDALRKVLYGGHREVDTTSDTVLRRAYIPQDSHSWGKEYHSETTDGYKISDYTPFNEPNGTNRRHFFGSLTSTDGVNCSTLSDCSDTRQPLLRVRTSVSGDHRIWEWASKERPVLGSTLSTGNFPNNTDGEVNYRVRVQVCTANFHNGCKQYPNGGTPVYKPVGLLHDYGENESMFFGMLSGSYDKPMSGGRLRKVVSSFADEVNSTSGQFNSNAPIVNTFNKLRIRDYNNTTTNNHYRGGWVATRSMTDGEFADWGNPVGELLYEATRYFAGKSAATAAYADGTTIDGQVGLSSAAWDDPYASNSAASASSCARANFLTISDVNPSFDSDQLPGVYSEFGSFTGDLTGMSVETIGTTISSLETNIIDQQFFIGQSENFFDTAPTPKTVKSLGRIRGLAPEEPTKEGSYYSASVARFAKTTDLRTTLTGNQTVDTYVVALSSPLPKIAVKTSSGRTITIVPFAKTVGGFGVSNTKGQFQPTNQIVDFYVEKIANSGTGDADSSVNNGRYYAEFQINFEDVEQGADHDMDAISKYVVKENALGQVEVTVTPTYQAGGMQQNMGYIVSGSTQDGVYLVARDETSSPMYFLNVPAGRTPGYCDGTLTAAQQTECQNIPSIGQTVSTYTFTTSTSPSATLLKDPLWYAAKHGGYVDGNESDSLDQDSEWDKDSDGVPDTYFFVQNPLKLKDSLKKAFENIIKRSGSGGNVVANSTTLSTETFVYQGIFNSEKWSGDLVAYQVTTDGVNANPAWRASQLIPAHDAPRDIYYGSMRTGSLVGRLFNWATLSSSEQALFDNSSDILNYLRGDRTHELSKGGTLRNRNPDTVLGDIAHSSPFYVKDSNTVFISANDGMLHAFDSQNGNEHFAYIPSAVTARLKNLTATSYNTSHEFFVDGDIAVSTKVQTGGVNYLVGTLGRGGKGLFGLNVSDPANFDGDDVLWEYFSSTDPDLGYMLGRPIIAQLQNGTWAVIIGNGYNSTDQKAVLYIFRLDNGTLIEKIDTGVAGDNGLSTPGLVLDGSGKVVTAYAGDLKGNVWKFDLSSSTSSDWSVAFSGQPLFTATSAAGAPQPITAPITAHQKTMPEYTGDPHVGQWYVYFGTGSDFQVSDPSNTDRQSWYGLIDEGAPIARSDLLLTPGFEDQDTIAGKSARSFNVINPNAMQFKKGWVIDLIAEGERMVTASRVYQLAEPTLLASSVIPVDDVCKPTGRGFLNAVNPYTGGRLVNPLFDFDDDGGFTDDTFPDGDYAGSIDLGVGKPGEPILIGDRLVVGGSEGKVEDVRVNLGGGGSSFRGRISWREIVR
jgi:type IV pilus assembly protein PilY1